MHTRLTRFLADQRVGFLIVGATNTLVGFATFSALTIWVFHDVPLGYLLSLGISYAIGISLAFVLYRRFVFKVRGYFVRDFARFTSVYLVAIAVNTAALPLLVEVMALHPLIAQTIILLATTLLSFFGHKRFSFKRSSAEHAGESTRND